MRTSARIGSIVLAGTLLMTLGGAPLAALADQPAAGAAEASQTAEAALELKTVSHGGIQFQVDASLAETTSNDPADFYYEYTNDAGTAFAQVAFADVDFSYIVPVIEDEPESFLADGLGLSNAEVGQIRTYTIDGRPMLFMDYAYITENGFFGEGYVAILCGADASAAAYVQWTTVNADEDTVWGLQQIGRSLAFTASDGGAPAGTGSEAAQPAEQAGQPAAEPAQAGPAVAAEGETLELPGWTVTAGTDPAAFVYGVVDSWDESVNGRAVIGMPVTFTNTGDESASAWWDISLKYFGPSGVQQTSSTVSAAGFYFQDSLESIPSLRPGTSMTVYVYFYDEGDGTYVVEMSAFDDSFNSVGGEFDFDVAR